jgi:hypothetical protein
MTAWKNLNYHINFLATAQVKLEDLSRKWDTTDHKNLDPMEHWRLHRDIKQVRPNVASVII